MAFVRVGAADQVDRQPAGTREARRGGVCFDHLDGAGVLRLAHGSSFR